MEKKFRSFVRAGIKIVALFVIINFTPLRFLIGGFIAAERISEYVADVYNVNNVGWYAKYNPVSSKYYMTFPQTSGDAIEILCDESGNIDDSKRSDEILSHTEIEAKFGRQDSIDERQFCFIEFCWKFDSPEDPIVTLHMQIRESRDPFPETDRAMLEKMAERFQIYCDLLTENEKKIVNRVKISYMHYAGNKEDRQSYDDKIHSIYFVWNSLEESIEDMIYSSNIKVE